MIKVALLGFWHVHHPDYIAQVAADDELELVCAWDHDPARGRTRAAHFGLEFCSDLDAVLAQADVDAVLIQAPTSLHVTLAVQAAQAGKHVFTDKVLAATSAEVDEILGAVDLNGVTLTVGMPHLGHDYVTGIRELINDGALGEIVNVRMMNCHGQVLEGTLPPSFLDPAEAQGGALIDMCHILYLTPMLMSAMPDTVFAAMSSTYTHGIEDSATVVAEYASGAHVSLDASFITKGASRMEIEVNGTEGSAMFSSEDHPGPTGAPERHQFIARQKGEASFHDIALGEPEESPIVQWRRHILARTQNETNVSRAADLTRLVEACYRSASSGCREAV